MDKQPEEGPPDWVRAWFDTFWGRIRDGTYHPEGREPVYRDDRVSRALIRRARGRLPPPDR